MAARPPPASPTGTRIELEDDFPGTLADLTVGIEEEEEAELEGLVVGVEGDEVTIETERGRSLTLIVGDRIRIELEDDFPGALTDLQVGTEVEAKFDPSTRIVFKIDVED